MSVRYRPRGFDCRPGRRVTYWFWNDVTEGAGIPPKRADGTVGHVGRHTAGVLFDGNGFISYLPPEDLGPEGCTLAEFEALPRREDWYRRYLANTRPHDWAAEEDERRRWLTAWPINPDLLERAVARYGAASLWRRQHLAYMARCANA